MGKDVIADRYARLYEFPYQLARLGHTVAGYCLDYQGQETGQWTHEAEPGSLVWVSRHARIGHSPSALAYPLRLLADLRAFAPVLLLGASDIPHAALTAWLARRLRIPYAIDLYDNFESFGQARLPGMVRLLRHAIRHADLVTTTSEPLRELVVHGYRARGEVMALPSTIDKEVFRPQDRARCREALGLPAQARLIGTAGGLSRAKGAHTLYDAWQQIRDQRTDVHLVLAGPAAADNPLPDGERVHYLGQLPHAQTAQLFNALDVGAICIPDDTFGRYCFPQKAYEMLACRLPVAAASVGAMRGLLADAPRSLYEADNAGSLAAALARQLDAPQLPGIVIPDWREAIGQVEPRLRALVMSKGQATEPASL